MVAAPAAASGTRPGGVRGFLGEWGVGRALHARTQPLGDLNSLTRLLRFCEEGISVEAPHFGEGAVRLAGSALRKSLLPEVFSTPPFPSSPGREREGSFGPVCPRNFSLFPSRTPRLGVGGAGSRPRVRTGSTKVKRSEQVGDSERGNAAGGGAASQGVEPSPHSHQGVRAPEAED